MIGVRYDHSAISGYCKVIFYTDGTCCVDEWFVGSYWLYKVE